VKRLKSRVRSIGNLPNEPQARLFGDYLLTQGIRNEVEREPDGSHLIWVLDDAQLDQGRALLDQFRQNPDAPEFSREAAKADDVRAAEEKSQTEWRRRVRNRKSVFPGSQRFGAGPLTYALIVASVVVAVFSQLGANKDFLRHLFISFPADGGAAFLPEVMRGEVWRVFTPMLVHFGPAHLLFNMMWLFSLGSMIESAQGSGRFILLIVAFAAVSNLVQYHFRGPFFGGMSGVNYGLIGYVWIRGKFDPASGLFIDRQNAVMAIGWFFLCLTGWVGHVANHAHGAGLILGMAWGWISARLALRKG
jgi:GlpG protein